MSLISKLIGKGPATGNLKNEQDIIPHPRKKASLLGLPPEIRLAIFAYALRGKDGNVHIKSIYIRDWTLYRLRSEQLRTRFLSHPLFHVGHSMIASEALEAFLATNNFCLYDRKGIRCLNKFLRNQPEKLDYDLYPLGPAWIRLLAIQWTPKFLTDVIGKIINKPAPLPPAFTSVRYLTLDVRPMINSRSTLLTSCTNVKILTMICDVSSDTNYWHNYLDPSSFRNVIRDYIKKYIVVSMAELYKVGGSPKTLIIDLRSKIMGRAALLIMLRWLISTVKVWFHGQCGDKLEIVGRFWEMDWIDIVQRADAKAARRTENGDQGLEGVADLFLAEM
ncbi:hypothetical protein BLS_002189 [Venturia inaequalis]|uniref:Uncharacterized protein n=1 Tax=Venturia inaequalis TaxID=5025 RepID=A0A8H3U1Q7_VENIN|nr:hypothetical protein BLS_002189 [Venturia inaequalis]KAE9964501.1 hypothetical protein EG328_010409 [Venturia inaequalis]KAE9967782.1 hypothetical protein EG327_011327 [Venturia inaequalis]RDI83351.1 hypothetical protein Vi05172_g6656 [Venturia inaequalis]